MIHLQGLTKYKESKKYKQSYVFMLLPFFPFFFICHNFKLWIHTWKVITDGLCSQVYETENINLSPSYMNFLVKHLV